MMNKTRKRYEPSFETDQKIIQLFALEKEYAQYDLPRSIGKTYRTILRRLEGLQEDGLIKLCRTEESKKGGKEKNILTLTKSGLLCALSYPEVWTDIDKVAHNYCDSLPLIFGKWDFYIRKGLRDEIIKRLQAAVGGFIMSLGKRWYRIVPMDTHQPLKIRLEEAVGKNKAKEAMAYIHDLAPTFTHRVLGPIIFLEEAAHEAWGFITTVMEDKDLCQYYDDALNNEVTTTKLEYEVWLHILKHYQKLKASKDS